MRVVLDTVVIIRALLDPVSRSGRIPFHQYQKYDWIVSEAITAEYLEVVSRPAIAMKPAARNRNKATFLDLLAGAVLVSPVSTPAVYRDPGDDKILAAALSGAADYIISEDLDLLTMAEYQGIRICNSQTMIEILSSADVP